MFQALFTALAGANWRTSVSAIATMIAGVITWLSTVSYDTSPLALVIPPKYKPTVAYIAGFATVILWVWNGVSQKDKNVTGGTKQQDVEGRVVPEHKAELVEITKDASKPKFNSPIHRRNR